MHRAPLILMTVYACLVMASSAITATENNQLPPGSVVLDRDTLAKMPLSGKEYVQGPQHGKIERIAISGRPFSSALRIRTAVQPKKAYEFQLKIPLPVAVRKGDVLLAIFYLRTIEASDETGMCRADFVMQQTMPPHKSSVSFPATAGGEWQRFDVPFTSLADYPVGTGRVNFTLGHTPQVIELAGLELINFGQTVRIEDLPRTTFTYLGREPDASWRSTALRNIELIRKADLAVVVEDENGRPLEGTDIQVKMTKHAFRFGTAISPYRLLGLDNDARKYQDAVRNLFNYAVLESAMKWVPWESRREEAIRSTEWLRENNIAIRGHTLVWERWDTMPADTQLLTTSPEQLKQRIVNHISDIVSTFRGQLRAWDVVNEPSNHSVLRDILGAESIPEWYTLVREIDPEARLFLNENRIEGQTPSKLEALLELVQYMQAHDAPLDGLGIQGHFGRIPVAPEVILQHLDCLAQFGLELEFTEFDMDTPDEELQADFTRDFLIAAFSHPAVTGVLMWGFWDGQHHKKNAPLFRKDWSLKPSGQAWMDLVFNQWWTDEKGISGADGRWSTRGFLGDYVVTVSHNGTTQTVHTTVSEQQPHVVHVILTSP